MSAPVGADIASVSAAWLAAAYEDFRRGGPDRAEQMRRIVEAYLVPWFAPKTTTVADITYYMVHDWLLHLVGRDPTNPGGSGRSVPPLGASRVDTAGIDVDGDVGLARAAELCQVSLPTMRRRWRTGQLRGAYRDALGHVRVPVRALTTIKAAKRGARVTGLSHSYVSNALWALRRILAFARANGHLPPGFDPTESLDAPTPDRANALRDRTATKQPRPLSLPECARVAAHLHVVHQVPFWLQRIMGMRISETFGVLLSDVVDLGDTGMLAAQGQGGRNFYVRNDHGVVTAVAHKTTMKTAAGTRVLVLPNKMMDLIRLVIDAFHTDPDTGQIDPDARLIPGVARSNEGGQDSYRRALDEALAAEGLASEDLGFPVSSHLLRKSLATDLAGESEIEGTVRRRWMGHRAGDDVFGRIYTLDHPEVAPLVKVAAILDTNIANSIGTLLTPTTRTVHWGHHNPMVNRADHVTVTLAAAGWLVDPGDPDDPLCDTNRVADELGVF